MQQSGPFAVTQAGKYAIWQTRKTYGQASVKMPTPIIVSVPDGKRIVIHKSFSNVRVSGFGEGRFQLFTFQAQPGDYQLELPDLNPERAYGLEIRKYRPTYQLVFAILSTILAAAALIGGIVLLMRSIIG